ncbi:MAG: OmpA family protein [bacterium]
MPEDSLRLSLQYGGGYFWASHKNELTFGGFGPLLLLGAQGLPAKTPSVFVEADVGLGFWIGEFRKNAQGAQMGSRVTGTLFSISPRVKLGYGDENWGAYLSAPLLQYFHGGQGPLNGVSGLGTSVGAGFYFGKKVFFTELSGGAYTPSPSHYFNWVAGIDLAELIFNSPFKPKPAPVAPPPPPASTPEKPEQKDPLDLGEVEVIGEKPKAEVKDNLIVINQTIQFDTNRSTLKVSSSPSLDAVAALIRNHPEILKVEIQGHTDDVGSDEYNQTLSEERAETVKVYLVQQGGVDSSRLVSVGYGRKVPLVNGATDEVRARNRRVQFVILKKTP